MREGQGSERNSKKGQKYVSGIVPSLGVGKHENMEGREMGFPLTIIPA